MIKDYEYKSFTDEMIRDRTVIGINDTDLRKRLFRAGSALKLANAIQMSREAETLKAQLTLMSAKDCSDADVNYVKRRHIECRFCGHQHFRFCGRQHELKREFCPAYGKSCNAHGKLNHFKLSTLIENLLKNHFLPMHSLELLISIHLKTLIIILINVALIV